MWIADGWKDYELLDTSDGLRLERWGGYTLVRPDPQVIWKGVKQSPLWKKADGVYSREGGGGKWSRLAVPESWNIHITPRPVTQAILLTQTQHQAIGKSGAAAEDPVG